MKKFYITTAIDYVNAKPHIGHAYEKIAADILSRYHKIQNENVYFLTGVDEHGVKVEKAALAANLSPQEFCDNLAKSFQEAWNKLDIKYDKFIRTTSLEHKASVQNIFLKLKAAGALYKSKYNGLYCEGCEDFVRERDLTDAKLCPNHLQEPKTIAEENYFFALSKYKAKIKTWLENNDSVLYPLSRKNEVINQLNDPELADFSITRQRSSLNWGIAVPGEPEQIIYVWIDALSNYITAIGYDQNEENLYKWWPADIQLIGKDITKFHSIYWIAMLIALNLDLPKQIYAHGFLTIEGQKISKSLGNIIDPVTLVDEFSATAVRFYLFSQINFDQDGDFSRLSFINCINAYLANNLGNLLNRTITMADRYANSEIPQVSPIDITLKTIVEENTVKYQNAMLNLQFNEAINATFRIVDATNKYLNESKPWTLFKENKFNETKTVLYNCLMMLNEIAILMYPFTPKLSYDIFIQLGYSDSQIVKITNGQTHKLISGTIINNNGPIFQRIEMAKETV